MPIKTRDPNSGAIIYTSTPEEIETSNYKRDIKKMKKQKYKNFLIKKSRSM